MSRLYLPDGVRTAVWRLVKARLLADAALNQPQGMQLVFFDGSGDRDATRAVADYQGPAIVFWVTPGPLAWDNEAFLVGSLVVDYQFKIPDIDDEDLLNLQEALEHALYPDDGGAFHRSLVNAGQTLSPPVNGGATTGQPRFSRPAAVSQQQAGRAGMLTPSGQFTIEVNSYFPA